MKVQLSNRCRRCGSMLDFAGIVIYYVRRPAYRCPGNLTSAAAAATHRGYDAPVTVFTTVPCAPPDELILGNGEVLPKPVRWFMPEKEERPWISRT